MMFVVLYGTTLVLYSLYLVAPNVFLMITIQVHTPLIFLFFAWLHFRGMRRNDWPVRFSISFIWIALTVAMSAVLIKPVYGYDWTYAVSPYVLQGQIFNLAAILVGAYVANRPRAKIIEIPEKVARKLEQRGS